MAPPFHFPSNEDTTSSSSTTTSHSTMFSFPTPTMTAAVDDATKTKPAAATKAAATSTTTTTNTTTYTTTVKPSPQQQYICSPFSATAASFLLRRRLLLPTFVMPTLLLTVPPMAVSLLSMVAYLAGCGAIGSSSSSSLLTILASSTAILLPTYLLSNMGISAIGRHAPNEIARQKALSQSKFALPFWSLVISIGVLRSTLYFLGIVLSPVTGMKNANNDDDDEYGVVVSWVLWTWGMFSTTMYWSLRTASACIGPVIGWTILSILVLCRYIGPFCPIGKKSSLCSRTLSYALAHLFSNASHSWCTMHHHGNSPMLVPPPTNQSLHRYTSTSPTELYIQISLFGFYCRWVRETVRSLDASGCCCE